jgi:hypothetical protein
MTIGNSRLIRPGHFAVGRDLNDKQKLIRELPVFWAEFCSNFEYKNCTFGFESNPRYNFLKTIGQNFENALTYSYEIGALENGYGHFFEMSDYAKLVKDFLYGFALYSVRRFPSVR